MSLTRHVQKTSVSGRADHLAAARARCRRTRRRSGTTLGLRSYPPRSSRAAARCNDLSPSVAPTGRTDERPPHALTGEDSFLRKVHRPCFGARAVTLAAPTPRVAGEGVQGAAATVEENAPVLCAAYGQRGRRLTVARRALPGASLGGREAGRRCGEREHREH